MDSTEENKQESTFKKPLLVGKIGRLPKKIKAAPKSPPEEEQIEQPEPPVQTETPPAPENVKSIPYTEPQWSGSPDEEDTYSLEVLKNGSILETINLDKKAFYVFGRLPNCDICMQHPTISRYHAVLQYRSEKDANYAKGFYIYDLESTHGTFLNKNRLRPRNYVKIHVGHMLKLGCSTRTYILNGPEEDREEESELSVTELKQKRQQELLEREREKEEAKRREEERGIDWGMGDDADEETDLSENPYAETNNEDLYIDNPKKTLRGFFEREGLELEYDCSEHGIGQFSCKVELPIDDEMGRPIFAEVMHKGKKKEAVVQCALEACRILDRHGLLRQATHESRKRKPKNWEENDYYDSDEDTFLDRTGSIEKKREKRMNAKAPPKAETYENLLEKEKKISESIKKLEAELAEAQRKTSSQSEEGEAEADPLDSFMMELKQSKPSKKSVNRLKSELMKLKQEHGNVIKLVNIAKPASLPPLVAEYSETSVGTSAEKKSLPIFGKRKKIKVQVPTKTSVEMDQGDDEDEEEEGKEEVVEKKEEIVEKKEEVVEKKPRVSESKSDKNTKESVNVEKKKRKKQKEEVEKKGYADYENTEDYSMWVPPSGQTGDGRTSLNDKYGY